jgi:hypothetical protein
MRLATYKILAECPCVATVIELFLVEENQLNPWIRIVMRTKNKREKKVFY